MTGNGESIMALLTMIPIIVPRLLEVGLELRDDQLFDELQQK